MFAGLCGFVNATDEVGEKPDILFIAINDMNDRTTLFDKNNPIQTNSSNGPVYVTSTKNTFYRVKIVEE
tara:strand:+ start:658 stop:864 length:207 start_codon:yes stop_codon:yes gene_type:complete